MSTFQFDPAKEKATLSAAIAALEKSWGKPGMAEAVADLRTAFAHAERISMESLSSLHARSLYDGE